MNRKTVYKISAAALALLLWQLVALKVGSDMLLASPVQVIVRLFRILPEKDFFGTVLYSFGRISLGFAAAFVSGLVSGVLAGRFRAVEYLLWPYVTAFKSVPVASFIILLLIWLDFTALTVVIAFLIAFPAIYSNVLQGMHSTDRKMTETADIYRLSPLNRLIYVYMPSVKPYLISSSGVAVGMAWKAGVAAEVIGMIDGSIGEKLYNAKVYFRNADLLCWTLVIIIVSIISEKLFVGALKCIFKAVEKS